MDASLSADGRQANRPSLKHSSKTHNNVFALPAGVDGRSNTARRFREVLTGLLAELGGNDALDATKRLQVRNAAMLAVKVEQLAEASLTSKTDQLAFVRFQNNLRRMLRDLGINISRQEPPKSSLAEAMEGKKRR